MGSVTKGVKSKGAAKKWLQWYRLTVKILIRAICVASFQFHHESAQNSPELLLLKFLPSTYIITAISWSPPLISQPF